MSMMPHGHAVAKSPAPVELFCYEDREVRTLSFGSDPWFVHADVCAVLEIRNSRDALSGLDDDEKGVATVDTPGGDQRVSIINEPGLYSLILRSRKPEARAFKRWITHEVLPAIRRTGRYEVASAGPSLPDLATPEGQLAVVDMLREQVQQRIAADRRAELEAAGRVVAEAKVAELEPRAAAADALTEADGTLSIGAVAKIFQVGRTTFFRILYAERILCKDRTPRSEYAAWFRVVATPRETGIGKVIVDHVSYLYPEGALRLHHLLTHRGYRLARPVVGGQLELTAGSTR